MHGCLVWMGGMPGDWSGAARQKSTATRPSWLGGALADGIALLEALAGATTGPNALGRQSFLGFRHGRGLVGAGDVAWLPPKTRSSQQRHGTPTSHHKTPRPAGTHLCFTGAVSHRVDVGVDRVLREVAFSLARHVVVLFVCGLGSAGWIRVTVQGSV